MANPVLVEAVRGSRVESVHRGAVAVVDADGARVLALGDVERPVYPRSAVKALQAVVMVEAGAPEQFGFGEEELAIACASHSGEAGHVATVTGMLARAGLSPQALECGAHWPSDRAAMQALARSGAAATALHNNCSGKHAGFLSAARAMGLEPRGYVAASHPVQREVKAVLETFTSHRLSDELCAIDGCSVPTWAIPLDRLARAFARFVTGEGLSAPHRDAAARLRAACAARPWHVAGTGRFSTEAMGRLGARVFVKAGAEGTYCAALPQQGFGIAVKCDDGAHRAAQIVTAALIARFLTLGVDEREFLARFMRPVQHNWNGIAIGELRPSTVLVELPT